MIRQRQKTGCELRGNKSTALPQHIVAIDTETMPVPVCEGSLAVGQGFRLGVTVSARMRGVNYGSVSVLGHDNAESIWDEIIRVSHCRQTTWVVGHNILFDFVVLGGGERVSNGQLVPEWPRSVRDKKKSAGNCNLPGQSVVLECPPVIIPCRIPSTNGRVVFIDTMNWFRCPLADIGRDMGLAKLDMPALDAPFSAWLEYCQRDTEIVFLAFVRLMQFVREQDCGMFRYTAPSQAFAAFRHRHKKHKILLHDNAEVKAIERAGYFGGRTECFRIGKIDGTVWHVDVSSLFPSVMLTGQFPTKLTQYDIRKEYGSVPPDLPLSQCVCECELSTESSVFPMRTKASTIYPSGQFRTTLCGPELQFAAYMGYIAGIRSWAIYDCSQIFASYVSHFWGLRQRYKAEGNATYDTLCKLFLNSLYGKFGQMAPRWQHCPDKEPLGACCKWFSLNEITGERAEYRSFGWRVEKRVSRAELQSSFPAISAFVTSYARLLMNFYRKCACDSEVLYQGVDSLIVTDEGYRNLLDTECIQEGQLGKLRLLGRYTDCEIMGCSDYRLGGQEITAGKPSKSEQVADGVYAFRRLRAIDRLFDGSVSDVIPEQTGRWSRYGEYTKGRIDHTGRWHPHVLHHTVGFADAP